MIFKLPLIDQLTRLERDLGKQLDMLCGADGDASKAN